MHVSSSTRSDLSHEIYSDISRHGEDTRKNEWQDKRDQIERTYDCIKTTKNHWILLWNWVENILISWWNDEINDDDPSDFQTFMLSLKFDVNSKTLLNLEILTDQSNKFSLWILMILIKSDLYSRRLMLLYVEYIESFFHFVTCDVHR